MKTRNEVIIESVNALQAYYNHYADQPITEDLLSVLKIEMNRWLPDILTRGQNSMTVASMLDHGDWNSAFIEANCNITPAPLYSDISLASFTEDDVLNIKHIQEGEDEILDWICIGQLKDGRWFNLEAGCCYTGWDCAASGRVVVAADYETLMRLGCNRETRKLFRQ